MRLSRRDDGGAVLHDTLEDTEATGGQLRTEFGNAVARLVGCLTEDALIDDLCERKSALRSEVEAIRDLPPRDTSLSALARASSATA